MVARGASRKPRVAVWKFSSCDGCQLSLLDCEDELLAVAGGQPRGDPGSNALQGFDAIGCLLDLVTLVGKCPQNSVSRGVFVIHHQDTNRTVRGRNRHPSGGDRAGDPQSGPIADTRRSCVRLLTSERSVSGGDVLVHSSNSVPRTVRTSTRPDTGSSRTVRPRFCSK